MVVRSALVLLVLLLLPGAVFAQRAGAASYTEDRINQLQQTLAELSRRVQELQKQNQQLQQQLEKMQASYERRLQRLENPSAGKAPPARKPPAKP